MNPVSYDMADYLEAQSLGVVASDDEPTGDTDWGVFVNRVPDRPISCITVSEAPSPPPTVPLNMNVLGTNPWDVCYFQVLVRAPTDPACWAKILAVARALNGLSQYLVEDAGEATVKYASVIRRSDFLPLETGENDVFSRSVNFTATRQELVAP